MTQSKLTIRILLPALYILVLVFAYFYFTTKKSLITLQARSLCITHFPANGCPASAFRKKRGFSFTSPYFGLTYFGNWDFWSDRNVLQFGGFELPVLGFIYAATNALGVKGNTTMVDVGAYHGTHTMFMSQISKHVHAFEPNSDTFRYLEKNIDGNDVRNVTLHQVGLGDKEMNLSLYDTEGARGAITSSFVEGFRSYASDKGEFPILRGDTVFKDLKDEKIGLIKIDIEGFEGPALAGLSETIKVHRPLVIVELSPTSKFSFKSISELRKGFPERYDFLIFEGYIYGPTSAFSLKPFTDNDFDGQPQVVAVPNELRGKIPMEDPGNLINSPHISL